MTLLAILPERVLTSFLISVAISGSDFLLLGVKKSEILGDLAGVDEIVFGGRPLFRFGVSFGSKYIKTHLFMSIEFFYLNLITNLFSII